MPTNQEVRVIILVNEATDTESEEEETAWRRLAAEQLLGGYSEEDAIYDNI